jgi:hypothetical protein
MSRFILASLFVFALGESVALADPAEPDCSIWRWTESRALDLPQNADTSRADSQSEFVQRYERYSFNGQPEPAR